MVDRTLDFLKAHADGPCFVNLWLDDPHTPWVPTADDQTVTKKGQATGKGPTPERLAKVMTELDRQVGRLLDAVRARKGDRPTVVLFLSDNGPLPSFDRARTVGLRGSKLSLYEGGTRLPFIAWGPGLVPVGTTNEATVLSGVDLFPTLCKLCGAELPEGYTPDGEDLSPALVGKSPKRTKPVFWEYGRNPTAFAYPAGKDKSPNVAVLDGDWKLVVNADGTGAELYDVAADPRESKDLAADYPDVARRLKESAIKWRAGLP
jgi:arylsulfatase A-like enzyme